LALNQEWIELDLFRYGLQRFSTQEFDDAGLNEDDRYLIEFMAEQEIGHARALGNLLGGRKFIMFPTHTYPDCCQYSRSGFKILQLHLSVPERPRVCRLLPKGANTEGPNNSTN
jgi:hypothetical protein